MNFSNWKSDFFKKNFPFTLRKKDSFHPEKCFPSHCLKRALSSEDTLVFYMQSSLKASVYLDVSLKTVLYILARGIIRKQCKSWLSWFPHPCVLVQGVQKFLHCGRGIKPNNLKKQPKCILLSNSYPFPP